MIMTQKEFRMNCSFIDVPQQIVEIAVKFLNNTENDLSQFFAKAQLVNNWDDVINRLPDDPTEEDLNFALYLHLENPLTHPEMEFDGYDDSYLDV